MNLPQGSRPIYCSNHLPAFDQAVQRSGLKGSGEMHARRRSSARLLTYSPGCDYPLVKGDLLVSRWVAPISLVVRLHAHSLKVKAMIGIDTDIPNGERYSIQIPVTRFVNSCLRYGSSCFVDLRKLLSPTHGYMVRSQVPATTVVLPKVATSTSTICLRTSCLHYLNL